MRRDNNLDCKTDLGFIVANHIRRDILTRVNYSKFGIRTIYIFVFLERSKYNYFIIYKYF
jgi:hypothetical protein